MARITRSHAGVGFPSTHVVMDPTPEQFRQDMLLLERKMGDYRLPLQASKTIIVSDVSEAFLKEKDPRGTYWVRLSDSALKVPRLGKLRRKKTNARMWRQMSNRRNYGITKDGVFLNQSKIVPYMPLHQQDENSSSEGDVLRLGGAKVAEFHARVNARTIDLYKGSQRYAGYGQTERLKLIKQDAREEVSGQMRKEAGKGAAYIGDIGEFGMIPKRAFIGPSKPAETKIRKVMDAWAKDVIIVRKRGLKSNPAYSAAHKPGFSGYL